MARAFLVAFALLAGCHAHTGVSVGPGATAAAPGASASIGIRAGPAVGALIGLGFVAATIGAGDEETARNPPPLDPTRRVAEQDCTRPIEDPAANLRCR